MALTEDQHIDYKQLYEQQLAVIEQQLAEKEQLTKLVEAKRSVVEALSAEIAQLRKMIFDAQDYTDWLSLYTSTVCLTVG